MVSWSEHQFVRENESEAIEICFRFLTKTNMDYLRSRLNYDVRSEFGNFRMLTDLWLKLFGGNHIRLIEFYEGAYDDRDIPRHEALIEVFLVTLAATILGEEYNARRKAIGRGLLNLRHKCILSLQYLLDMDALKFLEVNQIIDHQEYAKLGAQLRRRLRSKRAMPRGIARKVRPYYRRFGMASSSDVIRGIEGKEPQRRRSPDVKQSITIPNGGLTIVGLPVSPGVVQGRIRIIRNSEDAEHLIQGEIGVFYAYTPETTQTSDRCGGVIGTGDTGGVAGHLAIFAQLTNKPAVVCVDDKLGALANGRSAIVDGNSGKIHVMQSEDRK